MTRAELLHFVELEDRSNDRVATFTGGMKHRLNLPVALVHRPKFILLDEPTAGLHPRSREQILNIVPACDQTKERGQR